MNDVINAIFNIFMAPFEKTLLHKRRSNLISKASGNTLEIGSGGGINFDYYNKEKIHSITVLDLKFNKSIKKHKLNKELDINYLTCNAETLPFEDNVFDSVVVTLTLCAIDNQEKALSEIYRVLKPGAKLYFLEHVIPNEDKWISIAHKINHTWKCIGKCNINRATHKNIEKHGFTIDDFEIFGKECFIFVKGIGIKNFS